jgi:peptide/nickel transport system substrate-binding protein
LATLIAAVAFIAGCAPAATTGGAGPSSTPSGHAAAPPLRTVVVGARVEPVTIHAVGPRWAGLSERPITRLFNAGLLVQDPVQAAHPYMAEQVPQLNSESWRLFPDGRMETTYRLKPNLTWHDGHPLTAEDFVFAWQLYSTPESGAARLVPFNQIEDVVAPDDRTVLIRWKGPYPDAGAVYDDQYPPLPRHILEATFREGITDNLVNHPYWTTEYVGVGPYRLVRWEPGATIEGSAFEGHAIGRPKIDRVRVRIIVDDNTMLTNMLANEVQFAHTLRYEHAKVLRQDWGQSQTVVTIPVQPRFIQVQLRPELANPAAVMDARVRKALAHAIDKPTLDEALFDGTGAVTFSFLSPRGVPYYPEVDRAVTKYPYDPRQSEMLMNEAGLRKGADGLFVGPGGQRFAPEFRGDAGGAFARELAAVAEGWQRAGIDSQQNLIPTHLMPDGEFRSTFPALYSVATGAGIESYLGHFTGPAIPTAGNRWQGQNRGAWSNAEYDALWQALNTTLDRAERTRHALQMERILSAELPIIMLWHNFQVVAYTPALSGPDTRGLRDLAVWNVHQWEIR